MNIFILDSHPVTAARYYPDKLCSKISLEICQMIAVTYSEEFFNWGTLTKKDGTPYKLSHKNHPCTIWLREKHENLAWAITHGLALALEHRRRYNTLPATYKTLLGAKKIFEKQTGKSLNTFRNVKSFTRAMPDEYKNDKDITTVSAYRKYMHTKAYAAWNKLNNVPFWWLK